MKRWSAILALLLACIAIYFFVDSRKAPAESLSGSEASKPEAEKVRKPVYGKAKTADELKYENVADLSLIADGIKSRAEAGDAVAARLYAKMLEECWMYSMTAKQYKEGQDAMSKVRKPYVDIYKNIGSVVEKRCKNFTRGQRVSMKEYNLWYGQAVLSRDGQAIARLVSNNIVAHPLDGQALREGVDMIIASRDPEALLDLANLMGSYNPSQSSALGPYSGRDIDENAWRLAACRLGANCSGRSPLLVNYCVNGISISACMGYNLQETIRRDILSPSEYAAAWSESTQIINSLPHP
jgi:hypothetical protein